MSVIAFDTRDLSEHVSYFDKVFVRDVGDSLTYPFCLKPEHAAYKTPEDCIRVYLAGHFGDMQSGIQHSVLTVKVSRIEDSKTIDLLIAPLWTFPICGTQREYDLDLSCESNYCNDSDIVYKLLRIDVTFREAISLGSSVKLGISLEALRLD